MGFLKRIFSIGSKKGKKRPHIVHNVNAELRAIEEEEHEAAIGRLLRSSSARFAVVSEVDYTSLPPLPHPINEVIQTSGASTVSIASTSISQRGTYNVTVHRRQRHTSTEFLSTNRALTTPEQDAHDSEKAGDNSQLLRLRSDPSVASLLDMYDEHGRISATAFSNSPPSPKKHERPQTQRTGSTLRQLLGNPSSLNGGDQSALEGDISWAERFLGETNSISSTSSFGLYTPNTPDTHFPHNDLQDDNVRNDITVFSDHDISTGTFENPAISSMEVELSIGAESLVSIDYPSKTYETQTHEITDLTTPRRASQVFDFLTDKRRSRTVDERSLPELPSAFSFSSSEDSQPCDIRSHFSSDDSSESACGSATGPAIPPLDDTPVILPYINPLSHTSRDLPTMEPLNGHTVYSGIPQKVPTAHEVKVIMTAPTKVIVTAPTPSNSRDIPSHIPRGPRTQYKATSSNNTKSQRSSTLVERAHLNTGSTYAKDPFTPIPRRISHRRSSSHSSIRSNVDQAIAGKRTNSRRSSARSILTELGKENGVGLSAQAQIPTTPLRSKSKSSPRDSRSLLRAAVNPDMFRPPAGMTPSPASSSELSPVGRQLMLDLRQQRSKAREADRERTKSGVKYGRH